MDDDPMSDWDHSRIARDLWGDEALDEVGQFFPTSTDEVLAILRERVRELERRPLVSELQQVQLDLIRTRRFNAFDGERVAHDLRVHRARWTAALMDRSGEPSHLIKLRDLPLGRWNVDTLYVLARDERCARLLVDLGAASWRADSVEVYDEERTSRAIGQSPVEGRVVAWWWD